MLKLIFCKHVLRTIKKKIVTIVRMILYILRAIHGIADIYNTIMKQKGLWNIIRSLMVFALLRLVENGNDGYKKKKISQ